MSNLLVEIGVEELPARFIEPAVKQLGELLETHLKQERIKFGTVQLYSTPRRLAVHVDQLVEKQADLSQDVKGPPKNIAYQNGEPTKAALGFARSQGVTMDDVTIKELDGAEYLFAHKFVRGKSTHEVLATILPEIITAINFPKNMRWGNYSMRYARPLRWIVALLDDQVIPFQVENVVIGNISYGHRQLCSEPIKIKSATNYLEPLRESYVIGEQEIRQKMIWGQVTELASTIKGKVLDDPRLLTEVTNLVEYPTAFLGTYKAEYLEVPAAVLVTTMKEHQRYFPVYNQADELMPYFIGVRNGADNQLDVVIKGNEKVLEARLADAKFFYDEDRRTPLEDNLAKLEAVVFQEGLGSVHDKVTRIIALSSYLGEALDLTKEQEHILRTARLSKADLVSQMVNEFPELQGIMGAKYAELAGEDLAVVRGIEDHYKPRFSGDELPSDIVGAVVSIADKLDSLVGYFGIGKIPTGSQDPFALRRQALGIVQIIIGNEIELDLPSLIKAALAGYQGQFQERESEILDAVLEFLAGRLKVVLRDQGYRYDLVDAVIAIGINNLPAVVGRVKALEEVRQTENFVHLYTAFERCSHLAAKVIDEPQLDPSKFTEADQAFYDSLESVKQRVVTFLSEHNYSESLNTLANLRPEVDQFFDTVMIMDSDPAIRDNRLGLLKHVIDLFVNYADFSLIVMDM